MRVFMISLLSAMCVLNALSAVPPALSLTVTPEQCGLGDLVVLEAEYRAPELFELELALPPADGSYHLFEKQILPQRFEAGTYSQSVRWLIQPLQSETIQFNQLYAKLNGSELPNTIAVDPVALTVTLQQQDGDSLELMALPEPVAPKQRHLVLATLGLIAIAILLTRIYQMRRKHSAVTSSSSTVPQNPMQQLLEQLDNPAAAQPLAQQILVSTHAPNQPAQRTALEQFAYSKRPDATALRRQLKQEDAQ